MSGFRVVFVVRRFWPHWDGASRTLGAVAAALIERGGKATVLTTQEHPRWPARLRWRGVSMERLAMDRAGRWGEYCWMRGLARWVREHRDDYDLAYVSGLRHDAYAVLGAVDRRVPVALRAETAGRHGDCLWHLDAWCGERIKDRTMRAAAFVGPSLPAYRELVAAGYSRERVHYIPHGAASQPVRDKTTRSEARQSLATDHPCLALTDDTPLVVFVGQLRVGRGLPSLVEAWKKVAASQPRARLWLVGDGPQRFEVQQRIDAMNLGSRIALVGRFDEVDMVLAAADAFVLPGPETDFSVALLEAMAAGLPVIACDDGANREVLESERQGLLVPPGDSDALAAALGRLIDQPELARRLGAAARQSVQEPFSLARMVEGHLGLFESLAR